MSFIFLRSDSLDQLFKTNAKRMRNAERSELDKQFSAVRRPHRGIQIKDDTYATMSVIDGNGGYIPLISESATVDLQNMKMGAVAQYADFIIQQIHEERVEKQQIIETFGDSFIFFFGERPRMVTFQGLLMNTEDFGWKAQFWENYELFLRGSKLVQRNARAFLAYDTIVVEGYPIQATSDDVANDPYHVRFSMTMFVTNYRNVGQIGVTEFPKTTDPSSIDILNTELDGADERLVTSGAEVRAANIEAALTSGGLFSTIKSGIQSINQGISTVSGALSKVQRISAGKIVRKPLGVAGYLAQIEPGALVASGSLDERFALIEGSLGSVKVRVPRTTRFAKQVPYLVRGYKWMNHDEYPLRYENGQAVSHAMPFALQSWINGRNVERILRQQENEAVQTLARLDAQTENTIFDVVEDTIDFTKKGFALVNTTTAIFNNPGNTILELLGMSGAVDLVNQSGSTVAAEDEGRVPPALIT